VAKSKLVLAVSLKVAHSKRETRFHHQDQIAGEP
jgi:hypothetical protein